MLSLYGSTSTMHIAHAYYLSGCFFLLSVVLALANSDIYTIILLFNASIKSNSRATQGSVTAS